MATQSPPRQIAPAQAGRLLEEYIGFAARTRPRRGSRDDGLDGGERLAIVDALATVLGKAYCHLPQKRAAYARDPVQALALLRGRAAAMSEGEFHLAVSSIVTGLRDAHTRYSGPRKLQGRVAILPFLVEQYGPFDAPVFMVSKAMPRRLIDDDQFVDGVLLETWNGIPFARAVEIHADRETGGRPDARRAAALATLTSRALEFDPPPDEMWVDIGYRSAPGAARREVRIPWRVVAPGRAPDAMQPGSRAARWKSAHPSADIVRRAKKLLFSEKLWKAEDSRRAMARAEGWVATAWHDVLSARRFRTRTQGELGYLRVWSFDVEDDEAFLAEVRRVLDQLPDNGLVLDLRGNPGGLIWAAERMLQLFTPHTVVPTRFSLLASDLTRALAASPFNRMEFEPWLPSLERAIETGDAYAQPLPLTDPAWCNDLGQHYSGPVVCVVDATTYSSGDLFAAGFVDNGIGPLVCVGEATGAGGANVWTSDDVLQALAGTEFELPRLPDGVGFTLAIRRAIRSAASDGVPIEDLGVAGIPYAMTRNDLLKGNQDMVHFCAAQLEGVPRSAMKATVGRRALTVQTRGIDTLETYLDGRPTEGERAITDGEIEIARPEKGEAMEFVGRAKGVVVQRRRVSLAAK